MRFQHPIKASSDWEPALCDNTALPYRQEIRPPNRIRCGTQGSGCLTYPIPCRPQTDTVCPPGVLHENYRSLSTTRVRLSYRYAFQIFRLLVNEPDTFCLHRSKGTIIIRRMFCYSPTFCSLSDTIRCHSGTLCRICRTCHLQIRTCYLLHDGSGKGYPATWCSKTIIFLNEVGILHIRIECLQAS